MAVDESLKRSPFIKRNLMELVSNVAPAEPGAGLPGASPPAMPPAEVEPEFQPPPKKSDPLPRPGDVYRPHARFMSRLGSDQRMIHFIHGDFVCDGFAYHDLRRVRLLPPEKPGQVPTLVLRFIEAAITEVTIAGRDLDDLHYYISDGSMPWVWEQPKGFKPANERATAIISTTFRELEK